LVCLTKHKGDEGIVGHKTPLNGDLVSLGQSEPTITSTSTIGSWKTLNQLWVSTIGSWKTLNQLWVSTIGSWKTLNQLWVSTIGSWKTLNQLWVLIVGSSKVVCASSFFPHYPFACPRYIW
jgi:hypothetical protein